MEDNNIGFDPLESLGNDYGKINDDNLDTKDFQPFEGDRINTPGINFAASERFYPVAPAMGNLDRPNREVKQVVANSLTNTHTPQSKKPDIKNVLKAFGDHAVAQAEASQSKDEIAKIYAYDASPSGNAFYKRYAAYGQEKFDAIGFHPLRDNEANFNARTTKWDDWSRMMTHSFWPLFGQGFTSAPKSMAKLAQWDFSSDTGEASEYEEAAAIGQSTKGGVFGFVNNTALNFGYTAGIIVEAVAEELVGFALAAPTGGASLFAATANNAKRIFGIGKGIEKAVDGLEAVNQTIGAINNVSKARTFWETTRIATGSKLGRVINPLDNTFDAVQGIRKAKEAGDNITNLAKLSKTAGGFYRDVRNVNMALAEGRLEAGMVQNHVYDKLYNKHYEETGEPPSDQEQQYMIQQSKESSANTLFWNTGLIYLSNKITFDNITGPRGGLRNFMKSTIDDVVSVGGGKFGTIGKVVYDKTKKVFEFEKNNVRALAKSWWKNPGYKTAAKTIGYMKGNFSEGIQENLQEVISGMNERYYIDTFNSKGRRSHEYAKGVLNINKGDLFKEELGKQFTAQGLETFASGFIMGMPAGALNSSIPFLSTSFNRIFNKDGYAEFKKNKLKITDGIVKSLNDIDIKEFLNQRVFNYGAQDILSKIKQTGTKKEALDSELESLTKAMGVMVETNTTDIFIDKLKSYGDMNDAEFMDAMQITDKEQISKYRERVNGSIAKIERVKKSYDFYNNKFPNPVNLDELEDLDKNSDEYKNAVSLYHGWNLSVQNAVYFNESFEDCMKRMSNIQTKFLASTLLNNTGQREMGIIFQPVKLSSEIELLSNEIKSLTETKDTTVDGVKKLKDKKMSLKTLQEFKSKHEAFELFYNRHDYTQRVKKELSGNLGREATDEEVTQSIDKQLGSIDDEALQVKHTSGLRTAFNEYIKHIAQVGDDTALFSNLDSSFELLLDHYKLGLEGKRMVHYVNTLHDPNNFSDLARRNQTWMKDLYNSRPEYYENMVVKPELKNVEDNALLNRLASRNIFVSEEELIKWREESIIPTEFFDNTNKKVIPKGTEEYNRQVALFKFAADLQEEDEDISNGIYTDELKIKIEQLNAKETEDIEALPKVEVKAEPRRIKLNFRKKFTINDINNELKNKEYADVEYEENKELVKLTIYKDGNVLKVDNADGEEIIIKDKKYEFKYKSGVVYKINLEADPVEVETIKIKYSELRKAAIKESKVKPVKFKPITKDTAFNEYDENLQNNLYTQFEEFVKADTELLNKIIDDEELFEQELLKYINTNPDAIKLVEEYNAANAGTVKEPVVEEEEVILTSDDIERKRQEEKDELDRKSGRRVNSDEDEAIAINIKYNKLQNDLKQSTAQTQSTKDKATDSETYLKSGKVPTGKKLNFIINNSKNRYIGKEISFLNNQFSYNFYRILNGLYVDKEGTLYSPITTTGGGYNYQFKNLSTNQEVLRSPNDVTFINLTEFDLPINNLDISFEDINLYDAQIELYNRELTELKKELSTEEKQKIKEYLEQDEKTRNNYFEEFKGTPYTYVAKYLNKQTILAKKEKALVTNAKYDAELVDLKQPTVIYPIVTELKEQLNKLKSETNTIYNQLTQKPISVASVGQYAYYIKRDGTSNPPVELQGVVTAVSNNGYKVKKSDGTISNWINYRTTNDRAQNPYNMFSTVELTENNKDEIQKLELKLAALEQEGMNVGKTLSPQTEKVFTKLGLTPEMVANMSDKEIEEAKTFKSVEDAETMRIMLINRLKALGIKVPEITETVLNKNDILIAKKDIIIEDASGTNTIFAGQDDTVVISSINLKNGTVNLKLMGKKGVETFDISELNNLFTLNNVVMSEIVVQTRTFKPTIEEKVVIVESNGNVENFLDNSTIQKEIESKADKLSNSELDDDMLNDLDCN